MKIIGKSSDDTLIIQCTRKEIAQIMGYSDYNYAPDNNFINEKRNRVDEMIGQDFSISEIYNEIMSVKSLIKKTKALQESYADVEKTILILKTMAERLEQNKNQLNI